MIAAIEKSRENKRSLVIKNVYKIIIAKVIKVLYTINPYIKYNCIINNVDINVARDLGLINIKKYWRFAGQIQEKVNRLYKN